MTAQTEPPGLRPVRVRLWLGPHARPEIDAWPTPVPGLVIHRTFGQPDDVYSVTMQSAGVAVIAELPSPEHALGCAADLGPLADWTRPIDRDALRAACVRIAYRWGAPVRHLDLQVSDDEARAAGAVL